MATDTCATARTSEPKPTPKALAFAVRSPLPFSRALITTPFDSRSLGSSKLPPNALADVLVKLLHLIFFKRLHSKKEKRKRKKENKRFASSPAGVYHSTCGLCDKKQRPHLFRSNVRRQQKSKNVKGLIIANNELFSRHRPVETRLRQRAHMTAARFFSFFDCFFLRIISCYSRLQNVALSNELTENTRSLRALIASQRAESSQLNEQFLQAFNRWSSTL